MNQAGWVPGHFCLVRTDPGLEETAHTHFHRRRAPPTSVTSTSGAPAVMMSSTRIFITSSGAASESICRRISRRATAMVLAPCPSSRQRLAADEVPSLLLEHGERNCSRCGVIVMIFRACRTSSANKRRHLIHRVGLDVEPARNPFCYDLNHCTSYSDLFLVPAAGNTSRSDETSRALL